MITISFTARITIDPNTLIEEYLDMYLRDESIIIHTSDPPWVQPSYYLWKDKLHH